MKYNIKQELILLISDELRMRDGKIKMMIIESGSAERKARVIGNLFQKEIIDTHFKLVIDFQKKYHRILG